MYGRFHFVFHLKRNTGQLFRNFHESFLKSSPWHKFVRRPKNKIQILADSAAIRLVQKASKSEPSSRFFSHLKFRKSLPVYVLPKFPRRIQNRNGHIIMKWSHSFKWRNREKVFQELQIHDLQIGCYVQPGATTKTKNIKNRNLSRSTKKSKKQSNIRGFPCIFGKT